MSKKEKLVAALKEKDRTKAELCAILGTSERELRRIRHAINVDNSKEYEYTFIATKDGGGFTLALSNDDMDREYKLIHSTLNSYYAVLRKMSNIRKKRIQEHLF